VQKNVIKILIFLFCFDLISQFDSARKHGILLEAVQILSDLNLFIKKAYVSSDGRWFMDGKLIFQSRSLF